MVDVLNVEEAVKEDFDMSGTNLMEKFGLKHVKHVNFILMTNSLARLPLSMRKVFFVSIIRKITKIR